MKENCFLYLISSGEFFKFGISKDFKKRLCAYKSHNPFAKLEKLWIGEINKIKESERTIHENFKHLAFNNSDWFKADMQYLILWLELINSKFEEIDINSCFSLKSIADEKQKKELHHINLYPNLQALKNGTYFSCNKQFDEMTTLEKSVRIKEYNALQDGEFANYCLCKFD